MGNPFALGTKVDKRIVESGRAGTAKIARENEVEFRKAQDFVAEHLAEEISIERLAELVELSSSHFAHVFKETTGMTPLQCVTRERITRAQQMIRETARSLIEIGLEIGYTSLASAILRRSSARVVR